MLSLKVPPLGESVVEATVGRWLKKEGDAVQTGDTIVELETDKINVEVPAMKSGVLRKQLKKEGDVVKVDEVLAEMEEGAAGEAQKSESAAPAKAEGVPKADAPAKAEAPAKAAQTASAPAPAPAASSKEPAAGEQKTSPAARRLAAD